MSGLLGRLGRNEETSQLAHDGSLTLGVVKGEGKVYAAHARLGVRISQREGEPRRTSPTLPRDKRERPSAPPTFYAYSSIGR